MPEVTEGQPSAGTTVTKRVAPDARNLYVNSTEFAITPWDIQMQLNHVHAEASALIIEQVATVSMSPQHAKAFAIALASNVREWESNYGEITLPEGVILKATATGGEKVAIPERDIQASPK